MEDTAPNSTTVCRFRNTLVEAGLYDVVLSEINRQLEEQEIIVKHGTVTDENRLVLAEETTAANESGIKHFETSLKKAGLPQGTPVYADKG